MQVNACSTCDFRDIEAFDDKQAIIINSGYPAIIYKTNDGGNSWQEVFRKNDSSYFLDAMDFWDNKRGLILADPIDGRFVLLKTEDGGQNWQHVESDMCPKAFEGEAVFAASGTSLRCWGKNSFAFVSGGSQTRLFLFEKGLTKHAYFHVPFVSGKNTQGAFGLSKPFQGNLIAVCGGDYTDANGDNTAFAIFSFKKPKWYGSKSVEPITGYKSCVEFIGNNYLIICGTNGVEWVQQKNNYFSNAEISGKSFNTIAKAKKGNSVYLAGTKGTIALIVRGKTHHHSTKQ